MGKALAAAHMWRLSVILETHVKVKDKKQLHEIVLDIDTVVHMSPTPFQINKIFEKQTCLFT